MDNQNRGARHREVQLFLKSELKPFKLDAAVSYDLGSEYAKTRHNHSAGVWILLAVCFAVVGLATFTVTTFVTRSDKQIRVNIDTFNDLNLRSLLDMVNRTQTLYDGATKKKAQLQASLSYGLKQAQEKRDNDLFTLAALKLRSKKEEKAREETIATAYAASVKKLHRTYDVQISTVENEIKQYQEELSSFDKNKVINAQQQEAAIDSQRQLHELEMKSQADRYESLLASLRTQLNQQQKESFKSQRDAVAQVTKEYQDRIDILDPIILNRRGDDIIAALKTALLPTSYTASRYAVKGNDQPGADVLAAIKKVQSLYNDFDYTANIVGAVPQQNSVPSYVWAMRQLTYQIGDTMTTAAVSESIRLNHRLSQQQLYFETAVSHGGAQGMILDVSDPQKMPAYVLQKIQNRTPDGTVVKGIVKSAKKTTAEIQLVYRDGEWTASVSGKKQIETVHSGDFFMIESEDTE